jgi:uncharacterized membrane protein YqjE
MEERRMPPSGDLERLSTRELIARVADDSRKLVRTELELAHAELQSDVRAEIKLAASFGVSALFAFVALGLLFTALVAGLATGMPVWAAALVATVVALAIAALAAAWGWSKRARAPLGQTRDSVKETIAWTRHPVD